MNQPVLQYFERAAWALHNARNEQGPFQARSHLLAAALHACQSLKESFDRLARESTDSQLASDVGKLPHTELIENVRNMDLHGQPLPICDPAIRMVAMRTKPDQPVELSSSGGVRVSMALKGLKPVIGRVPKDLKHGVAKLGGTTVSYACDNGHLLVHDLSTGKDWLLAEALLNFLAGCRALIERRACGDSSPVRQAGSGQDDGGAA